MLMTGHASTSPSTRWVGAEVRISLLALGAALSISLTACGSSTDTSSSPTPTVSVESQSASGAVASAEECPANSPVRGPLLGALVAPNGVYGHVYNRTGRTIYIHSQAGGWCRVEPDKGASFASTTDLNKGEGRFPFAPWRLSDDYETWLWMLVTYWPDNRTEGVAIGIEDPRAGWPTAASIYREEDGGICERDNNMLKTFRLFENDEYRLKGSTQGSVLIKRLPDSKGIAREWMPGHTNTDDWARIDVFVEAVPPRCY